MCYNNSSKDKSNLISAVGKDKVYEPQITKENTNSLNFINFLKLLFEELSKDKIKKYVIVLDNFPSHKTEDVINFLKIEK